MFQWIQTHGFEALMIAGLFSLVMSSAPNPPARWGFWRMWAFNALKAAAANAAQIVKRAETIEEPVTDTDPKS